MSETVLILGAGTDGCRQYCPIHKRQWTRRQVQWAWLLFH